MKPLHLLAYTAFFTVSSASYASNFQYEVSAEYSETREEVLVPQDFSFEPTTGFTPVALTRQKVTIDSKALFGSYYFSPVDTSKGPLAEAAFLDRSSRLSVNYGESRNTDTLGLSGLYVHKENGWFVGAGYSESDFPFGLGDADSKNLTLGYYLAENTAVSLDWADNSSPLNQDTKQYRLNARHVGDISANTAYSISGFLGTGDGGSIDSQDSYGFNVTLYPNQNLGIGFGYIDSETKVRSTLEFTPIVIDPIFIPDGDIVLPAPFDPSIIFENPITVISSTDRTSYQFFARWFFNDNTSLSLSHERSSTDTGTEFSSNLPIIVPISVPVSLDDDSWSLRASVRF